MVASIVACDNKLAHYGVKGMKWGVRRIRKNPAKAFAKYNRKQAKAVRYAKKAYGYSGEASGLSAASKSSWDKMNATALAEKASKAHAKALKYDKKAQSWFKKMEIALKDTPYDLTTPESRQSQEKAKSFIREQVESQFWKGYAKPFTEQEKKRKSAT